jgi:hypothetical protein
MDRVWPGESRGWAEEGPGWAGMARGCPGSGPGLAGNGPGCACQAGRDNPDEPEISCKRLLNVNVFNVSTASLSILKYLFWFSVDFCFS